MVSELFDDSAWERVGGFEFTDLTYHRGTDVPVVRIAFDRPGVRNAFRPETVDELYTALDHARRQADVGCVLLTGNGPSPTDGGWAFCSGGDQSIRGESGYEYSETNVSEQSSGGQPRDSETNVSEQSSGGQPRDSETNVSEQSSGEQPRDSEFQQEVGRLHILEVQRLIRFMPKPVVCVVPGWAAGGGHSLHVVCDLTLASEEHARFKQTDADVASFDGGYGSAYLARQVGQKKAREIFFLGRTYDADEAAEMGMVNEVVPHDELEDTAIAWADSITRKSPMAIRMLKFALNLADDGLVGQQVFAGEATRLGYMTEEASEGRNAFNEGRNPNFRQFPWHY